MRQNWAYEMAKQDFDSWIVHEYRHKLREYGKMASQLTQDEFLKIENSIERDSEGVARDIMDKYELSREYALPGRVSVMHRLTKLNDFQVRFEKTRQ